jgi:hypothetical protein
MTEQDLLALGMRNHVATFRPRLGTKLGFAHDMQADLVMLYDEVRRLQGLVKAAEQGGPEGHDRCNTTGCPWCFEIGDYTTGQLHAADCPAFSAPAVLR